MPAVPGNLALEDVRRVLAALGVVGAPESVPSSALTAVGDGFNDVFVVDPPEVDAGRFVLKVGTFSSAAGLRGGVAAARALRAYTDLPIPEVLAFDPGSEARPPAVATEYCDGEPLASGFDDVENLTDPARVSLLGAVVAALDELPADAASGYGNVQGFEMVDGRPHLTAPHDGFDDWIEAYTVKHLEAPVSHPAIERVAPDALEYFQAERHRLPSDPEPSVVLTDLSPGNLLATGGRPPETVDGLAGFVDLERAKLGPVQFTAANLEYLLTAEADDPTPVREALYGQLPFGAEFPLRDLYRFVSLSRPLSALEVWEDPETDRFDRRCRAVAREIEALID